MNAVKKHIREWNVGNYKGVVALIKRMKKVKGEPPEREKGKYIIREKSEMGYGEALALVKNVLKIYALKRRLKGRRPQLQKSMQSEVRKTERTSVEKVTYQPAQLESNVETIAGGTQPLIRQSEKAQPLSMKKTTLSFKKEKEEVAYVKPLLGLSIPSVASAEALANKRISLLTQKEGGDIKELSKKLIMLTQQLLREKDPQKRSLLRDEISHVKNTIKQLKSGKGSAEIEDISKALKEYMQEDVNKAVEAVKSGLSIYAGLEEREKVCTEAKKAVEAYKAYLRALHSAYVKEAKVSVSLPTYDELDEAISDCLLKSSEKGGMSKETLQAGGAGGSPVEEIKKKLATYREAQLLHELSVRDRKSFVAYLRGELSKKDALRKAKELIVRDMIKNMHIENVDEILREVLE